MTNELSSIIRQQYEIEVHKFKHTFIQNKCNKSGVN